jgi:hypothetical protein
VVDALDALSSEALDSSSPGADDGSPSCIKFTLSANESFLGLGAMFARGACLEFPEKTWWLKARDVDLDWDGFGSSEHGEDRVVEGGETVRL